MNKGALFNHHYKILPGRKRRTTKIEHALDRLLHRYPKGKVIIKLLLSNREDFVKVGFELTRRYVEGIL